MPITNAQQWRARAVATHELQLPSGAVVLVRRPPLHVWVRAGKLPDSLVQAALATTGSAAVRAQSMKPDEMRQMFVFIRDVVIYSVVEPRIVETVENPDEEISADDVPLDDVNFIFEWAMKGGTDEKAQVKHTLAGKDVPQIDLTDLRGFRTF